MSLTHKIDFAVIFSVKNANPNGDPLNGNRPRQNAEGYGEVSDVCLKRKIRNRLQDMGEEIFVQPDDNRKDDHRSLYARFEAAGAPTREMACKKWFDVRAFGQVFAFKAKGKGKGKKKQEDSDENDEDKNSVSVGIRGPVTIQSAFSVETLVPQDLQITRSVNLETNNPPEKRDSDTIGVKRRIDNGIYITYGAINAQLAEKTGFSDEDANKIKEALKTLFENDASSARPEGSMEVLKVIWWAHKSRSGQFSSAKVHRSLSPNPDGTFGLATLLTPDLEPQIIDGT
ncbi:MAG: type I-C CRISPR-associated protein Cas7/Csd2 [Helicobacteraceae bacterium]|jgi:CRISPR-associated protein Csd2|nr:type I-C CRISPR-associated protein Cas7/Csd2 [Helicobacteraceae bacterium]